LATLAARALRGRTFVSLRKHRNYRLYFTGQIISATGTWMQDTALPWLVLQRTHSPVQVGLLLFCRYVPFALFGLVSGVVADRFDNRVMLMTTQAASMTVAALLAVVAFTGAPTAFVYMLAVLGGTAVVFDNPNRHALTYRLVGRDELQNAVALNSSIFNAGRVIGPALGGVVIAAAGVGFCFALNSISFLAVLVALALMRPQELYPVHRSGEPPRGLGAIREGLGYVRRRRTLRLIVGSTAVVGLVGFNVRVLIPVLTVKTLDAGPHTLGILFACFGLGALSGALVTASASSPRWRRSLAGLIGLSAGLLALALPQSAWTAAALLAVVGLSFSLWSSTSQAMLQLSAPDALRGRVLSLYLLVFGGLQPIGSLLSGWLASIGGTRLAFLVAGASLSVVAAYDVVRIRSIKEQEPRGRSTDYVEPLV
jgi:MFS family permease